MKTPYYTPYYHCGACGSACRVRETSPEEGTALVVCQSRYCAQRDQPLIVTLPRAVMAVQQDLPL